LLLLETGGAFYLCLVAAGVENYFCPKPDRSIITEEKIGEQSQKLDYSGRRTNF
jgi:hypothetical protein